MNIRCLSFHADYACQDSGACCTAGWPIPVENDRLDVISRAIAERRLLPLVPDDGRWVTTPSDGPAVLSVRGAACTFFDRRTARHCGVQHALGHDALPLACRQFPRVSLIDPRGISLTLSNYCPTAASLLSADGTIVITSTPTAFPRDGEYVGLDVRDALPPLLRPDMAMDWESWWSLEAQAIELIARSSSAAEAMVRLSAAVEALRPWSPANGPLSATVDDAFESARTRKTSPTSFSKRSPASFPAEVLLAEIMSAIPAEVRPAFVDRGGAPTDAVLRRLLAAHAFANWTAHLGEGLRTWLRSLEAVVGLAQSGFSVSRIDLLLRHLSDPHDLARVWSSVERA